MMETGPTQISPQDSGETGLDDDISGRDDRNVSHKAGKWVAPQAGAALGPPPI